MNINKRVDRIISSIAQGKKIVSKFKEPTLEKALSWFEKGSKF